MQICRAYLSDYRMHIIMGMPWVKAIIRFLDYAGIICVVVGIRKYPEKELRGWSELSYK